MFRRTGHSPGPAGLVPDADALRQAALRASWARDHTVRRRRIAWRWVLWFMLRFVVPAAMAVGATAALLHLFGWWNLSAVHGSGTSRVVTPEPSSPSPVSRETKPATSQSFDTMPLKIDSRLGTGAASADLPGQTASLPPLEPAQLRTAPHLLTNKEP